MSKEDKITAFDWILVILWFLVTGLLFWAQQSQNNIIIGMLLPIVLMGVILYLFIRYLFEQKAMLENMRNSNKS